MIGIASKFNTARITGLYLIFASVSFMIMLVVLAIFYSEEWKGIFNKGQSERSAFHSGKQYTAPNIKEIPDGKGPETPVDLPSADPSESSPKSPLQSNEESDQSSANIDVPVDKIVDYKVVKGDGLWSIARRSGVTVENLKQWNNLSSDIIYIGQVIKIYGKDITPPPSAPLPDGPAGDSPPSLLLFHGSLHKKQIALTFDAGSDSAGIEILDILKRMLLLHYVFLRYREFQ
ncbi:MAG TPA: hypothetical protein DCR24_02825, partial [Bacillus bacterium]|nr:hypothetical protein [Bacillus sp. (in: firmicutes)]